MDAFPIFWSVKGRTIIVFGGGQEAAAKLRLVKKTSAHILVITEEVDEALAEFDDVTTLLGDPLTTPLPDDVALAYTATGNAALDADIARRLGALKVPVCAADQPAVSDFITPAIVDRDPVIVAIGTEGTAPVLAREIKGRVERLLPAGLGRVARKAGALREHVARTLAPGAPRRRFWHALFEPAMQGAFERTGFGKTARVLLSERADNRDGLVSFVGAGAGGPDLLTERARQRIDRAEVILHDALVAPDILELARREATFVNVGKRASRHALSQDDINALIVEHAKTGARIVRLKGGDPSIFGRLAEEIDAVAAADLAFEIVPGVTAASVAAASAKAPLTERGRAQELRIITAQGADDAAEADAVDWASAASGTAPLAIYMGRRAAPDVQRKLLLQGRKGATPVVLVESAGRTDERLAHTTLAELGAAVAAFAGNGPLMMLIGVNARTAAATLKTLTKEAA